MKELEPKLFDFLIKNDRDPKALEMLWAWDSLRQNGHSVIPIEPGVFQALKHDDPYVRRWAVKMIGEGMTGAMGEALFDLVRKEESLEVKTQMLASATAVAADRAAASIAAANSSSSDFAKTTP